MINEFYCCLNNAAVTDMDGVIGGDLVDPTYLPVNTSARTIGFWKALFGEGIQTRQYWVTHARQAAAKHLPSMLLTKFDPRTGYRIDEIQKRLTVYFKAYSPTVHSGWSTSRATWWADEYVMNDYRVEIAGDGNSASLFIGNSTNPVQTVSHNTANKFVFDLDSTQEIRLTVATTATPIFSVLWATRPRETVSNRVDRVLQSHKIALSDLKDSDDNRYDRSTRAVLHEMLLSPTIGNARLAAAGLLIAGRFAYIADHR